MWVLPFMIIGAIIASVTTAVLMERIAYRPLRNAPRLAPLITAIGVSVFLQEAVRLFYGKVPFFDFPDAKQRVPFPQIDVVTGPAFQVGGRDIQRSALFTIGCLADVRGAASGTSSTAPSPAAACRRSPRTPTPPG